MRPFALLFFIRFSSVISFTQEWNIDTTFHPPFIGGIPTKVNSFLQQPNGKL